ncbi:uncharacterized protein LOC129748813 [Uranotaenia lowii]|uniref:uncharacterized protein LOC129748813 n=1 Tax=Uranotaenia lowii TaxID=190385 RepID=UPI00247937A8|nr:uncharacterized protein LOC129748813 [Uranotaenia lowii]
MTGLFSSSDDETTLDRSNSQQQQQQTPPASSIRRFLKLLIEAIRKSPPKENGVSIVQIKKYLRANHRVMKKEMTEILKPTMEKALRDRLVIKTSAKQSILSGSVKLNPDLEKGLALSDDNNSGGEEKSSAEEQVDEQAATNNDSNDRKRKAEDEPDPLQTYIVKKKLFRPRRT